MYPAVFISDIHVKTSVAQQTIHCEVWLSNASDIECPVTLAGHFASWNGINRAYPQLPPVTLSVPAHSARTILFPDVPWLLGSESYWWPNVPYRQGYRAQLHEVTVSLDAKTGVTHSATRRFGFRELRQAGAYFTLNGVRINFRGDNLQVANYDRIDHGGKGDAIDTLPGFLPPSHDNPGWPQAVDNFLRLNYNVQREHMGPWTPYMLDVCDEMGLMLIGESACRWDGFDMDRVAGRTK